MTVSIFTGVPGTGKTAHMVDLLEAEIEKGRIVFTNIAGLKLPHYRLGSVQTWHQGTWLHIDRYIRTSPFLKSAVQVTEIHPEDDEIIDDDGEINWTSNKDVKKADDDSLKIAVRDSNKQIIGFVPYESHKGALIVIDECQNYFRPRPAGSAVPDHVAAFEVHRKQDLDFWLVTQRIGLIDSNVRGLCGRHVALRSTALGRYRYEWPEVGDIDNKTSRDLAARTRYTLPKHVFGLYKSAESHTKHSHKLPFTVKALFVIIPLILTFSYKAFGIIDGKFHPQKVASAAPVTSLGVAPVQKTIPVPSVPLSASPVAFNVSTDTQLISACMATSSHCQCYTHDGIHLVMSDSDCRSAAAAPNDHFRLNLVDNSHP
jgi:zona occludens toxin